MLPVAPRRIRYGMGVEHGISGRSPTEPGRAVRHGRRGEQRTIGLTSRRPTVSLTKQGAATGNLRVNLSWKMRTSDLGGRSRQSGRLLRHPLKLFQPEPIQAHTQAMATVDLDIGCLYELADGSKGVVQPWAASSVT